MGNILPFKLTKPPQPPAPEPAAIQRAREYMRMIPRDTAEAIIQLLATQLAQEVHDGLFLNDEDDSTESTQGPPVRLFFDQISEMFYQFLDQRPKGCYFCDPTVDPNETAFSEDVDLCPMCRLKLSKVHEWMKGLALAGNGERR